MSALLFVCRYFWLGVMILLLGALDVMWFKEYPEDALMTHLIVLVMASLLYWSYTAG